MRNIPARAKTPTSLLEVSPVPLTVRPPGRPSRGSLILTDVSRNSFNDRLKHCLPSCRWPHLPTAWRKQDGREKFISCSMCIGEPNHMLYSSVYQSTIIHMDIPDWQLS